MITINKNVYNEFILYLNEDITLDNPYFVFEFKDIYNRSTVKTLEDLSTATKYNKFGYTDASDFSLYSNGTYYVYESPVDASVIDASTMNLLEYGLYKLEEEVIPDITYDPSISIVDSVFDPCSGYTDCDYVFDPIWLGPCNTPDTIVGDLQVKGNLTVDGSINAGISINNLYVSGDGLFDNDVSIAGDLNVVGTIKGYVKEASLNEDTFIWEDGILDVSVAGGVGDVTKIYVDGSLATRDTRLDNLDTSVGVLDTAIQSNNTDITNIDSSISDLDTLTQTHTEEINDLDDYNAIQDASIAEFEANYSTYDYVDGSLALRDTRLDNIDSSVTWLDLNKAQDGLYFGITDLDDIKTDVRGKTIFGTFAGGSLNVPYTTTSNANGVVFYNTFSGYYGIQYAYSTNALVFVRRLYNNVWGAWKQIATFDDLPTDFYSQSYVDGSLGERDTRLDNVDTSISLLDEHSARDDWSRGNVDLDDIYTDDRGRAIFGGFGSGSTNTPFIPDNNSNGFMFFNSVTAGYGLQIVYNSDTDLYTRRRYGGVWGPWTQIAKLSDIPTDFYSQLYVDGSLNTLDSSISLLDEKKLNNTTDTFTGLLTIDGSILINGNIYQDGSVYTTHAEQIETTKDYIIMREGATVALMDGSISGLNIQKADGTNNVVLGTGPDAIMRVGWENDTLIALAGREDSPTDEYYAYWDDASTMFKTKDLKGYIDGSLATKQDSIPDGTYVKEASIGDGLVWNSGALDVSIIADVTKAYVDGSLGKRDVSINWLVAYNAIQDASIAAGGGGSFSLGELTDVSIGDEINNQVLAYDLDASTYMNKTIVDVSLFSVVDASDYFWILNDVSLSGVVNNQSLAWDTASSKWINKTLIDASLYDIVDASSYIQSKITYQSAGVASDATGEVGDWALDASYLYVCNSTNTWGRIAFETGY